MSARGTLPGRDALKGGGGKGNGIGGPQLQPHWPGGNTRAPSAEHYQRAISRHAAAREWSSQFERPRLTIHPLPPSRTHPRPGFRGLVSTAAR